MRSAWETFSCPSHFLSKWLGHKNTDLGIRTYPQQLAYGHVQLLAHEYSICIRFISWSKDWHHKRSCCLGTFNFLGQHIRRWLWKVSSRKWWKKRISVKFREWTWPETWLMHASTIRISSQCIDSQSRAKSFWSELIMCSLRKASWWKDGSLAGI